MTADSKSSSSAILMLDRLVSANSARDVISSLEAIEQVLENDVVTTWELMRTTEGVLEALLQIVQHNQYHSVRLGHDQRDVDEDDDDDDDPARVLSLRIYQKLLRHRDVLVLPAPPGRLVQALVDVACSNDDQDNFQDEHDALAPATSSSTYARVLSLDLLKQLSLQHASLMQQQVLSTPNGLHRLGHMINSPAEAIRNHALLLAEVLAAWPSAAKILMFHDVAALLLGVVVQEGGLTQGNVIVLDCLKLLHNLLRHDAQLSELFMMQASAVMPPLMQLLDLRQGLEFMQPPSPLTKKSLATEDDLDDLLQAAAAVAPTPSESDRFVPHLLPAEEAVVRAVLDVVTLLLSHDGVRRTVLTQERDTLVAMLWELALVRHVWPPACALPSAALQQSALQCVALYLSDYDVMQQHYGLDRLNVLACTGGGGGDATTTTTLSLTQRLQVSLSAQHVVRRTLGEEQRSEILMQALVGSPHSDDDAVTVEESDRTGPQNHDVIPKLLHTLRENLRPPSLTDSYDDGRKVSLAGSCGVLSIFLHNEASRSVFLRLTSTKTEDEGEEDSSGSRNTSSSLLETILALLTSSDDDDDGNNDRGQDEFAMLVLLRFLCHFTYQAPLVVQALLGSSHSVALPRLLSPPWSQRVQTMTALVLGTALTVMASDDDDALYGGWTRTSILSLLQQYSHLYRHFAELGRDSNLPWTHCSLEAGVWRIFYQAAVLDVRKCIVNALTAESSQVEADSMTTADAADHASVRSLRELIAQQASEMDELRQNLAQAGATVAKQEKQVESWKLRIESAPTQLDELLTDVSDKNGELEARVKSLEDEARQKDEEHCKSLKERDATIDSLRRDLAESRAREAEARDECESMREDMTALSHAYSSLEDEFRRQSQPAREQASSTAAPTGEEQDARFQQPQGEVSEQAPRGSTELVTLRAEITRLRSDAREADNWMSMAVERMNAMGEQNQALQLEMDALRFELAQQPVPIESDSRNAASDKIVELQSEHSRSVMELEQALYEERSLRESIEGSFADMTERAHRLEEARLAELEGQLSAARKDASEALESLRKSKSEKEDLERKVERLQIENRAQLEASQLSANYGTGHSADTSDLDHAAEILKLRTQLETESVGAQKEIYERESKIRALESRLASGFGGYTVDDIQARDEEIQELRQSIDAAQDWMAKAVEHDQSMADRLLVLQRENESLNKEISLLNEELSAFNGIGDTSQIKVMAQRTTELEAEISARLEEVQKLTDLFKSEKSLVLEQTARIEQLESTVHETQSKIDGLNLKQDEDKETIAELRSRLQDFENSLDSSGKEVTDMEKTIADLQWKIHDQQLEARKTNEDLQAKCSALETQNLSMRDQAPLREKIAELELVRTNLQEQIADQESETEVTIQELQSEYPILESTLRDREASLQNEKNLLADAQEALCKITEEFAVYQRTHDQSSLVANLRNEVENLGNLLLEEGQRSSKAATEWEGIRNLLESKRIELERRLAMSESELEEANRRLNDRKKSSDLRDAICSTRIASLETQVDQLRRHIVDEEADADKVVAEWQAGYGDLEAQVAELRRQLHVSEGVLLGARDSEAAAYGKKAAHLESESDRIAELEAELEHLRAQMSEDADEASKVLAEWQEGYSSLEAEVADLHRKVDESEVIASDRGRNDSMISEGCIPDLKAEVEQLRAQIAKGEQESCAVVAEWQERYALLEGQVAELKGQLQECESNSVKASKELASQDEGRANRISDLEAEVKNLRKQMAEEEQETEAVVASWQESYAALEFQFLDLERRLEESTRLQTSTSIAATDQLQTIASLQGSIAELNRAAASLRLQHIEQEERCDRAESCLRHAIAERDDALAKQDAAENELIILTEKIEQLQAKSDSSESQVAHMTLQLLGLQNSMDQLSSELDRSKAQPIEAKSSETEAAERYRRALEECIGLRDNVSSLEGKYMQSVALASELEKVQAERLCQAGLPDMEKTIATLEANVADLQARLQEDEQVVQEWQESYSELQQEKTKIEFDLQTAHKERGLALQRKVEARKERDQLENSYSTELRALKEKIYAMEAENETMHGAMTNNFFEDHRDVIKDADSRHRLLDEAEMQLQLARTNNDKANLQNLALRETNKELQIQLDQFQQERSALATTLSIEDVESVNLVSAVAQLALKCDKLLAELSETERAMQEVRDREALSAEADQVSEVEAREKVWEQKLAEAEQKIWERDESVRHLESRVRQVENDAACLESDLNIEHQEAAAVVTEWQEKYALLEAQVVAWQGSHNEMLEKCASLGSEIAELQKHREEESNAAQEIVEAKDRCIYGLSSSLKAAQEQLETVRSKAERNGAALTDEVTKLKKEALAIKQAREEAIMEATTMKGEFDAFSSESEEVIAQWKDRVDELELDIENLREELARQQLGADEAIASWAASCARLEERLQRNSSEADTAKKPEILLRQLKSEIALREVWIQQLDAKVDERDITTAFFDTGVDELSHLHARLEAMNTALAALFASIAEERSRSCKHIDLAQLAGATHETTQGSKSQGNADQEGKQEGYALLACPATIDEVKAELDSMKMAKSKVERERADLLRQIDELNEELDDANAALQIHITNEVSGKAAQIAAEAFRHQLDEIHSQQESDDRVYKDERIARLAAQTEASHLRADLAALMGMEHTEINHGEIQRRAMEASEQVRRSERDQVDALRKELTRALEDLESARASERDAQDRLARANTQLSIYERDFMDAKTNLKFLTDQLEETVDAAASREVALTYRSTALEKDHAVVRKFHAAEMDNLRNELDQSAMERDRLLLALKESERSKEAFVNASKDDLDSSESNVRAELMRLRLERAHLLSAASTAGSLAERRLREAVAAEKASGEADVILERELRRAAEKALANVRLELEDLRRELHDIRDKTKSTTEALNKSTASAGLRTEADELKERIQLLSAEKNTLQLQVKDMQEKYQKRVAELIDECRAAKVRAVRLEESTRREAEIQVEVSRLQALHLMPAQQNGHDSFDHDRSSVDKDDDDDVHHTATTNSALLSEEDYMYAHKLYTVISKQKEAIDEERHMYLELLNEHDELLALLAQVDVEKSIWQAALLTAGGEDAVRQTAKIAEDQVVAQYGRYVKVQ